MKWIPRRNDGDQTPIEARKFKHWIGTQEHWFCVHESLDLIGAYTVSDWTSGMRVAAIEHMTLAACRGDAKDAARLTLNKLVERLGESRVLNTLRNAPARSAPATPAPVAPATL